MSQSALNSPVSRFVLWFVMVVAITACLSLAQTLFVPVFIALLLAILLHLPVKSLERFGVPRWLGALTLTSAIGSAFWVLFTFIAEPLDSFARDYEQTLSQLREKLLSFQVLFQEAAQVGTAISEVSDEVARTLEDPNVQEVVVRDGNFLVRAASSVAESATTVAATLIICGFILAIRHPVMTLATMLAASFSQKRSIARVWRDVETHIAHFFFVTTLINIALGIVVGSVLYALGVPMPIFWGILVGLLNYMPFIGPTIGALSLLAFCILEYADLWLIVLPPAIYLAINFFEANFVTPSLVGRKTEIPTLALILSLFFWGWLWGFVGLFIAIPFLVVVKAVSLHVDALLPVRQVLTPRRSL